jgi:putative GTP pyrophosphokinase
MDAKSLRKSYEASKGGAEALRKALEVELEGLMELNALPVAIVESRTKTWLSIANKMARRSYQFTDIKELPDFIGLRLVFLFSTEALRAVEIIPKNFEILDQEDKRDELELSEFGYRSVHFNARLNEDKLKTGTFGNYSEFQFEIQIRTLSEHNWAVASRTLQYTQEDAVPPSVRRSLYRLAALLEIVDSELERISKEKADYASSIQDVGLADDTLNADLLIKVLEERLPSEHRHEDEKYAQLFADLQKCQIDTVGKLTKLIEKHLDDALKLNAESLKAFVAGDRSYAGDPEKAKVGVYYTYVGLVRSMLDQECGTGWRKSNTPTN